MEQKTAMIEVIRTLNEIEVLRAVYASNKYGLSMRLCRLMIDVDAGATESEILNMARRHGTGTKITNEKILKAFDHLKRG